MSESNVRIDLRPDHLAIVRGVLRQHVPSRKVLAFGSRTTWIAKEYSDLDLAILGEGPLSLDATSALAEGFGESDLPFKVDFVDWAKIDETFRDIIRRDGVAVQVPAGCSAALKQVKCSKDIDWGTAKIEDIAEKVAMGPFGSSIKVETFVPKGIPIISGQHLRGVRLDDSPGYNFITEEHALRLANSNVQRGDIILTHRGNIGQVSYIPNNSQFDKYIVSQSQFYMRCDRSRALSDFVVNYFRSAEGQHKLLANASQVGVPSIAQPVTYLRTIEIPLPPLAEQRAIAHILGTLDDKIELNRRMNETLEAMAHALFKSWFISFDPVRAKMKGRVPGLPTPFAGLFPDRLVDSEIGEIPEGWGVNLLSNQIELNPKRTLRKGQIAPYLDMASMPTKGHVPDRWFDKPFGSGMRFLNGDTLLARITPCLENGKTAYVDFLSDGCVGWGSTEYIVMRPKPPVPHEFAYCLARSPDFREFAIHNMTGTSGRQRVSAAAISHFPLASPTREVAESFGKLVRPLFLQASANACTSRALAAMRDALLPKFISGEIRLRDAECIVETAI